YAIGTPEEIKNSKDPVVQQFINRRAEGPITQELFEEMQAGV
ncbi:MAG: ABC transporter ATP-binding protein, partial [Aquificae bacterium]|nr:ABC transporter ATP-binding protein [Aquificota bacterium]